MGITHVYHDNLINEYIIEGVCIFSFVGMAFHPPQHAQAFKAQI